MLGDFLCFEKSLAPAIALRYNRRKTNQFNQFYAEVNFRFTLEPRRNFAVTLTNKVLRVNMRCITSGLNDTIIIINDDRDNRNTHFPNVTLKRRAINRFLYSRVTETQTIPNVSRTKYISNMDNRILLVLLGQCREVSCPVSQDQVVAMESPTS